MVGVITLGALGACTPARSPEAAPSLQAQCARLEQAIGVARPPAPPATSAEIAGLAWSHCGDARSILKPMVLIDHDLQIARMKIVDGLDTCHERLLRLKARWSMLKEQPSSPQRAAEEDRFVEQIGSVIADLPLAMEPHLIAMDARCGTEVFAPRVDVMKPQTDE